MFWAVAAMLVLAVCAEAAATPLAVHVRWQGRPDRRAMEIALRVGPRRFTDTWPIPATPAAAVAPHAAFDPRRVRGGAQALTFWAAFVRHLAPRVRVTEWTLDLAVGMGDAAGTAIVAGILATVVGTQTGALGRRLACVPHWRITPRWDADTFLLEGEASVGFDGRVADLVGAAWAGAAAALRRLGGRERARWGHVGHRGRRRTAHYRRRARNEPGSRERS
ncbi:MAG: DUF2953 domain-containing protein [Actinomycetia bacterium]|nr:DUF2953 domain-containing protein [Actinomycetes bacterium]